MGLVCSSTWGRIWFVEYFHLLSAAVGVQMPGVPLQPVGQAGLLLCLHPPWVLSEAQGCSCILSPPASLPAWLHNGLGCLKLQPMGPSTSK